MIEAAMREYPLYILSDIPDEYGQIGAPTQVGTIRAAVYVNDRQLTDNVYYSDASYIALTWHTGITDKHLIKLPDGLKKVQKVLPGRMTRLLLADWGKSV